jgi:hypothetical protein
MRRISFMLLASSFILATVVSVNYAQRGGRGGGGGGFGGGRPGGFTAAAVRTSPPAASQLPARGSSSSSRVSGIGPGGGSYTAGKGGGSYTTQRGGTIEYAGAGRGGTTAGGVSGGRAVGGVKVTTAGGQEFSKVGRVGGVSGPGGNTVARGGSVSRTTGPAGSGASIKRGGVAVGPNGMAGYRGGVAVGPGGAAGFRTGVAVTPGGTYYRSTAAIRGQGVYVRAGQLPYYPAFRAGWWGHYRGAWYPARWVGAAAWTVATWGAVATFAGGGGGGGGYPAEPMDYDYGSTVVYEDNSVYVNGDNVGTAEQFSEQATTIADAGKQAQATTEEEWLPLGVFAMVQGEETTSNNIFQLAINKEGVIRGNYYNALTDTNEPVSGSVDKKTQRAAWMVGDKKTPVYEAGIGNLTNDETTMMVHYSKDRSQQFSLFRIEQPPEEKPGQ